jgi:hypothetical protein
MSDFFNSLWNVIKTDFGYIFTGVSAAFSLVISEIPDDEVAIMHGAMGVAADSIKAGRSAEETFSDVLNYVAKQEIQELSKVAEHLIQAFIASAHPDVH